MSNNKSRKLKKDKEKRSPADKLVLDFLRLHGITLVADRQHVLENASEGLVYTVSDRIRIRAMYKDEIEKQEAPIENKVQMKN